MNEQQHVENIAAFADAASRELGDIVHHGTFRFGVAQKIVNLYLKYLWVADYTKEPPHCPVDGRIARKASIRYQWTTSDSRSEYEAAIDAIRSRGAGNSVAQWELREFEVGRQ